MNKDTLGDRIKKNYEDRSRFYLTRRMPVIIRLDGKAFHTYTKGMNKPFDNTMMGAMECGAIKVARMMQGCKAIYTQSDEVSFLLTDYDKLETEAWYDYNKSKIESISASTMSVHFNMFMGLHDLVNNNPDRKDIAVFDARSFNVPKEDVPNYFLWRMKDCQKNAISMIASEIFSHAELHGKSTPERKAMIEGQLKRDTLEEQFDHTELNGSFFTPSGHGGWVRQQLKSFTYDEISDTMNL